MGSGADKSRRDSITKAYRLSLSEFIPKKSIRKVGDTTIVEVVVRHPRTDLLLGYITFTYDKDGEGELEITNYGSSLEPWHLQMGGTSKHRDPLQSGQFGEGLKRAIATFRRKPSHHTFRIVSSGFNWSFGWDRYGMLNLNLRRMEPQKLENERQKTGNKPRTLNFRAFEEGVSIIIGQKHQIYSKGEVKGYTGSKIRLDEFERMLKFSSIIIDRPESITTPIGSIILPAEYGNKLYTDGLLVRRCGLERPQFRYGYDFHDARLGLDRSAFHRGGEVTVAVNDIWATACRMTDFVFVRYTDLILEDINRLADVSLNGTSYCLPQDVARMI
jgi:hypothetical protein